MLYPLKFIPLLQSRIWGGRELGRVLSKVLPAEGRIGESWELSGVPGYDSVIANGPLRGTTLRQAVEKYNGALVGERVYAQYGAEFPVLIKFIDAQDDLSIPVHPDDALAAVRHRSPGKTEMWVVVDAAPEAFLYVGFNRPVSREEDLAAVASGALPELLKKEPVKAGDTFFIPAGTIHAIGAGCLIAEIQQTSDITYRVDDWGRVDENGRPRQLHTEQALDAIDFGEPKNLNVTRPGEKNTAVELVSSPYFTTDLVCVDGRYTGSDAAPDSFRIFICLEGKAQIETGNGATETLTQGETLLLPAAIGPFTLIGQAKMLEVYLR
jgi:mannose-6-phosphate isomerase